ncbi:ankyrin-3-like [Panicum miliaceum]|uniref:Ankyrin-3-like n=1 Tax=Panicum miliaceum TaxID=4540 RepID=A0A3L6S628_PANMI|nr:ankyrin-3-like [Panicum miliaceum]
MDPELYKAATHGKVAILKQLLQDKGRPDILSSTTPQRNTVLHLAALHGHTEFAREVLQKNNGLIVARNVDGDTPLHLAAKEDKMKVAELLVGLAKAWQKDPNGAAEETPPKSPLVMTNRAGNTPLHEAMRKGRSAMALLLLSADPDSAHDLNGQKESPLHMAAREGLEDVVRKILESPWVEEEYKPSVSVGGTALHQAVLGRHTQILLEKRPALMELTDADGNNALHYAAQKDRQRAVEMLLKNRADLAYKCNNQKQTPLHVAARYGSAAAIKALLRQCPDVAEMTDAAGHNAFHTAVASGKTNALPWLLHLVRPADLLNRVDNNGNTPLHLAAEKGHVQCALLLVKDRRVDPCIRNRSDHTARSLLEVRSAQGRTTHSQVEIRSTDDGAGGHNKPHTQLEIRSDDGEMEAYEMYLWKELKRQESKRCRMQQLPPVTVPIGRRASHEYFERSVETYILVAILIATVTFAATFTMPGGYDQNKGIALRGHNTAFKIFVISNTVAMCSAIIVVFCFIWAWKNPIKFMVDQLLWGHRLTISACFAMLVSLMNTVYITVAPTSRWPAYVVIAIGMSTPAAVVLILGKEVIFVPL